MDLKNSPLFRGFSQEALDEIRHHLKPRHYRPDECICRQGEPGDSLFLIRNGLVEIIMQRSDSPVLLDRLRRGDILGEMALLTGEPRTASAVAAVSTEVLELRRAAFAAIIARYPKVLFNISQTLIERYKRNQIFLSQHRKRGEAVAVVMGRHACVHIANAIACMQGRDSKHTIVADLTGLLPISQLSLETHGIIPLIRQLDGLLAGHRTVIIAVNPQQPDLHMLMRYMDRIELIAELPEALGLYRQFKDTAKRIRCILVGPSSRTGPENHGDLPVSRTLAFIASSRESAWLARHLTGKKVGLALGAGGARGFAHLGVLQVLEQADIPIDYIAGSSIGAMVGSFLAMGMNAAAITESLKQIWSPETVAELNVFSAEGHSVGMQTVMRAVTTFIGERTFVQLDTPLTIMTADLNTQTAAPINTDSLAEALCAGITIPGMTPPHVRGSQRLVDGIAIVPVPTAAVKNAGADIVIAVNLLHRNTLTAWPTGTELPPSPFANPKASKSLDPVIETLVMLQLDTSVRNAAEADWVVNPAFPALSWRAFHLTELIQQAGQRAACEQLSQLLDLIES